MSPSRTGSVPEPVVATLLGTITLGPALTLHVHLVLKAVQGQGDAAHQHVGVYKGAVDLLQEHLELEQREHAQAGGWVLPPGTLLELTPGGPHQFYNLQFSLMEDPQLLPSDWPRAAEQIDVNDALVTHCCVLPFQACTENQEGQPSKLSSPLHQC